MIYDAGLNPETYLKPIDANDNALVERFEIFSHSFDRIAHAGRIASLLDKQPKIKILMEKLIPDQISDDDFWIRYFFTVSELETAQKSREALLSEKVVAEEMEWSSDEDDKNSQTGNEVKKEEHFKKVDDALDEDSLQVKVVELPKDSTTLHSDESICSNDEHSGSNYEFVEKSSKSSNVIANPEKDDDWGSWE